MSKKINSRNSDEVPVRTEVEYGIPQKLNRSNSTLVAERLTGSTDSMTEQEPQTWNEMISWMDSETAGQIDAPSKTPLLDAQAKTADELDAQIVQDGLSDDFAEIVCEENGFIWSKEGGTEGSPGCMDPLEKVTTHSDKELEDCLEKGGVPQVSNGTMWCHDEKKTPKENKKKADALPGAGENYCSEGPWLDSPGQREMCASIEQITKSTDWVEPASKVMASTLGVMGGPIGAAVSWGGAAHDMIENRDPSGLILNTVGVGIGKASGAAQGVMKELPRDAGEILEMAHRGKTALIKQAQKGSQE